MEGLPDDLILAALERAELHSTMEERGVAYREIVAHLGWTMGSATGRVLRPRVAVLEAARLVGSHKRHSVVVWTLTRRGRERLNAARAAGSLAELPESPQHRRWREARAAAAERIGWLRGALQSALSEATALLDNDHTNSKAWSELGERLARECQRLSSATYCLREWEEPSDDAADTDSRNAWRRNTNLWNTP